MSPRFSFISPKNSYHPKYYVYRTIQYKEQSFQLTFYGREGKKNIFCIRQNKKKQENTIQKSEKS